MEEKKKESRKRRNSLCKNIVLAVSVLAVIAVGGYFAREYYLKKNTDLARENVRQYSIKVLGEAVEMAVESVKTDAAAGIQTAKGLQEAWQEMWPEEVAVTEENREDFARILQCEISEEDKSKVVVSGLMEGIPESVSAAYSIIATNFLFWAYSVR